MLSRSFNPSKCKTSLRLACSRLKLLRNKKEVQVKQMKREIAQLLESNQDQTARIRVEHVIREEKMMAAYDLIGIYCELIVARLLIIESQKKCPIDLKEAIASIMFASPKCGDVPELLDVRKQFTAKYGKDFTTVAFELRPQCGVSRMLVEKLSATAPDLQTKIKILSAIAEEHNAKWDHKPLEEKDLVPPNNLLSGPSTFGRGSQPYAEPSRFASPDVQAPPSNKIYASQSNSSQQDTNASPVTEKLAPAQSLSSNTSFQRKERPPHRQSWTLEFKDATSAAQSAAESAERASMAARAAAELVRGDMIMRHYSTESHKSEAYVLKDEGPEGYMNTKKTSEHLSEERVDRLHSERDRLQNEQKDGINANHIKTAGYFEKDGHGGKKLYSQSASLNSKASIDKDFLDQNVPVVDGYSRRNSLKEDSRGKSCMKKQSFKHEAGSPNGLQEKSDTSKEERISKQPSVKSSRSQSSVSDGGYTRWPDKSETIKEERISKQPSVKSFRSHSSVSDDVNIFANSENPNYANNDPFAEVDVLGEDSASVHFDKFDSIGDDHGFDEDSDTASGKGLNFGKLTGGLRHMGYNRPPYSKDRLDWSSSPKEQTNSMTIKSTVRPAVESPNISKTSYHKNSFRTQTPKSDVECDSSEEEVFLPKSAGQKLKTQELHKGKEMKPKLSLGPSKSIFGSDDSDLDDDTPKESISRKTHLRGGISRRTKASPSSPGTISYSKMRVRSEALHYDANDRKPTASYKSDNPKNIESQKEQQTVSANTTSKPARSNYWGPPEQPYSPKTTYVTKHESKARVTIDAHDTDGIGERKPKIYSCKTEHESAYNPNDSTFFRTPELANSGKMSYVSVQESKIFSKPSDVQESSSASVCSDSSKAASHNKTYSRKDGASKKASHVHPKLPDYDFLVQSLRKNRS